MRGTTGIVDAIDRTNRTARVQALGSASGAALGFPAQRPILYAKYHGDPPPPPLSYVDLDQPQPGVWKVQGSASQRRLLVHDDFLTAQVATDGIVCDTNWRITNIATFAFGQPGIGVGDAQGCGLLVSDGGGLQTMGIAKDEDSIQILGDPALWLSARLCTTTPTNSVIQCGFGAEDALIDFVVASATDAQAAFVYDSGDASAKLNTAAGTNEASLFVPFVPTDNVFFNIDIVVVGDDGTQSGFASMWVDGNGPYTTTTFVPPIGFAFEPYFAVSQLDASSTDIRIDWMHCETFTPVANPLRDLVLPESSIIA